MNVSLLNALHSTTTLKEIPQKVIGFGETNLRL